MAEENPLKPFYSVLVLAFVCSALVAGAAVGLRPMQEANKVLDRKKHILFAANLFDNTKSIDEMFTPIETRVIELATGDYVPRETIQPENYNQVRAAFSEETGQSLERSTDIAKLKRIERYSLVYLVKDGEETEQIVLPVRGKGLWSTMYAYVALDGDLSTIRGVSFYEHGETPGLGGEVENQRWQNGWQQKRVYNESGDVGLRFVKGKAETDGPDAKFSIDGISGATLTTKGVDSLMQFWFGDHGFRPFISQLRKKDNSNG